MINVYNPAFQVNLSQKYYLHSADAAIITAEDRSWFKKQGTIRIGYLRHMAPFIEEGPDGKARGIFRDLIDHGFEAFDIHNKVEYVPYSDPNAMKRDLIAHAINAALPVYDTPWESERLHILQTPNVLAMQMYRISRTDEPITDDDIIAVADDLPSQTKYAEEYFPNNQLRHYQTENDTKGHKAGDELIRGVAECLEKTIKDPRYVGHAYYAYRIGGDEFTAIWLIDDELYLQMQETFREYVASWKGAYCDFLSISLGWASRDEFPMDSIDDLLRTADKRMYEDKAAYYHRSGIDRRKH